MKFLRNFVSAILGGISIGLGSAAYLALKDNSLIAASLIFSVGFLAVVVFEFGLFTDKSGYLFTKNQIEHNLSRLFTTLLGNLIGAWLCGAAFCSKLYSLASSDIRNMVSCSYLELFVGSIVCGILIFITMHGYRKAGSGLTACVLLVAAGAAVMLCGGNYVLFNMFLMGIGVKSSTLYSREMLQAMATLVIGAIGNAVGAVVFASLCRFKDGTSDSQHNSHRLKHHD